VDLVIVIVTPISIVMANAVFFWFWDLAKGSEEFGLDRSPVFQVGLEQLEACLSRSGPTGDL
jgi:hypothetical protein